MLQSMWIILLVRTLFGISGAEFGFDYLQCICLNGSLVPHAILIYVNVELFWLNFSSNVKSISRQCI